MIRIEITDPTVVEAPRKGYVFFEQTAWASMIGKNGQPDPHPSKIVIQVESATKGWPKGVYQLSPQSLYLAQYSKLALGRLVLSPLK